MRRAEPDLLVSPQIRDVRVLDFHRMEAILDQAQPQADNLHEQLREMLERG
ncbi:MAG: hypothetical protein ACLFRW_02810 [Halorhodospira sp.]